MPKDSKVHHLYEALMGKGHDQASAARIAQAKTGLALATGKPPKKKSAKRPKRKASRKRGQSSGRY